MSDVFEPGPDRERRIARGIKADLAEMKDGQVVSHEQVVAEIDAIIEEAQRLHSTGCGL